MNDDRSTRWSLGFWRVAYRIPGAFGLLIFGLMTLGCHEMSVSLISESVLLRARWVAESAGFEIPEKRRNRVLLYQYKLGPGQRATSADTGDLSSPMICENRCWLFFVDFHPTAHFAHTTAIALYDLETKRTDVRLARWWPAVESMEDHAMVPIFRTFAERSSQDDLVQPPPPYSLIPDEPVQMPLGAPVREVVAVAGDTGPGWWTGDELGSVSPRWALLVQGYSDQSDTFRDDVSRAKTVLTGIGVPEENIEIVKPDAFATDLSCISSVQGGIEQLVSNIHDSINGCEELVVFFSSHARESGPSGGLFCSYDVNDLVDERYLGGDQLAEWLEYFGPFSNCYDDKPVACDNVTVVLQSCSSGSYITEIKDSLLGVNRVIITSSDAQKMSYTDLDDCDDPNEGDVGSEFSSGFWRPMGEGTPMGSSQVQKKTSKSTSWRHLRMPKPMTSRESGTRQTRKRPSNPQALIIRERSSKRSRMLIRTTLQASGSIFSISRTGILNLEILMRTPPIEFWFLSKIHPTITYPSPQYVST